MQKFVGRISALMNPICLLVVNGAIIALIWTGAIRVSVGLLTQGAVVALYNYMSQILVELIKLANLIINVTKAAASWRRIDAVFSIAPSVRSGEAVPKKAGNQKEKIVFRQAGLQYAGAGAESLTGVDLKISQGQIVGIIGGTGSGKTSLVNLIPRSL